jgi:tetratricopeptide (TPR) repeat protein
MEIEVTRDPFIGREKEIVYFKQWLTNTDPDAPWILSLYDALTDPSKQGGVGKTWLLRKFSDIAKQIFPDIVTVYIDFFNIADRDGVAVAEHVVKALKAAYPEWDISASEKNLQEYSSALLKGKEDVAEMRDRFADALIADLHTLDDKLSNTGKSLLVFLDTYELIEENPLTAALRLDQAFPDNYDFARMGIIIAGRNALDWNHTNWRGRKHEVQSMPISPFTLSEIEEYFEKLSSVNISIPPDDLQALYERTEGRPILIGLVNDVLSQRIMTLKELISIPKASFEASLVAQINELENPIAAIILFMAHAYHRFNFSLLDWILRESDFSDLLQDINPENTSHQLLRLSFVRRPSSGEDFVLHDEMRPLVNRYCWDKQDPDRRSRKILSKCAIEYYEHELQQVQSEQLKQAYTVELLYHKLYVDLENGYTYFSENFSRVVNLRQNSFARSLLHEAQQFRGQMSPTQRYNLKYGEARLLQKEEAAAPALNLFQELEQEADQQWLDEHNAGILFEKGVAYQQLSRYPEAIECFTSAMEIDKRQGRMSDYAYRLNWLGFVYRQQGQLDTALRYYEDGLEIHKGLHNEPAYANALLSISTVYNMQGKVEEALRRAKTSLRIRQNLFKQGKMSEVYVGWSLTSIGTIYYQTNDLLKADAFFQEALDIFARTGHKRGLATIYNRFGKLSMDRGELYYARHWFEKAYSTSLGIDTASQINSLNKQGWILVLDGQYQRAIDLLQQAINLAKEVHDDYQQAESLIDLGEALKRSGRSEQAQQAWQAAKQICLKYNYSYLLGLSSSSQGDVLYGASDYKEAFRHYGEACYYMTQYNNLEYNKLLRKVVDALFEVPSEEIGPIVDELVTYWSSQGLDKDYPDFVSSCQEVKSLVGF